MATVVLFATLSLAAVIGLVISVGQLRFKRRVARELQALHLAPRSGMPLPDVVLPAPVQRYRELAVGTRAPVQTLRLLHHGTFRMTPTAKAAPIRGTQFFTADPPGFLWTGRIGMFPGAFVDARDMFVEGRGSMRVLVEDVVAVVDESGPHIDQGSALRLLAEMVWYPTALFDGRCVTWSEIDAHHARATLHARGQTVTGVFEFGPDGMPTQMSSERFIKAGELRPWGGTYRDWRTVSGMRVPFEAEVTWQLDAGPYTYAHWLIDSMEFDGASGAL